LPEPEQREPRLRLVPVAVRLEVGRLRGRVLAAQPQHLALLVERLAGGGPVHRPLAPLARLPRLPERVAPGAAVPHDLGAVDLAAPAEGDEVGLLLAPARERVRPLAGAPRLEGLLAARDHPAVHDS